MFFPIVSKVGEVVLLRLLGSKILIFDIPGPLSRVVSGIKESFGLISLAVMTEELGTIVTLFKECKDGIATLHKSSSGVLRLR